MLFVEQDFLIYFLPLSLLGFVLCLRLPVKWRNAFLIWVSLYFYACFKLMYLPILLGSVVVNYVLAAVILRTRNAATARWALVGGIIGNLLLLGVYKYLGFFAGVFDNLTKVGLPDLHLLLPLAISFFTFQQISYLVDCHAGKIKLRDHKPVAYTLFVTFFPQLIAGPIVHHSEMMPQFARKIPTTERFNLAVEGACLFAIGLAKKLLIADSLSPIADQAFDVAAAGGAVDGVTAWLGALAYTGQIYFDFSGYSDMAIGLGLLFGIRLPLNFNSPYKALSIADFWRRWHMTLSRWLRDYLYIPMGGNRHGAARRLRNLMLTMLLGGLWHGAHWNFVIWGGLHGGYLIAHQLWRGMLHKLGGAAALDASVLYRAVAWGVTFVAVVVAWVFFRATTTSAAIDLLWAMSFASGDVVWASQVEPTVLVAAAFGMAVFLPNAQEWMGGVVRIGRGLPKTSGLIGGAIFASCLCFGYLASLRLTTSPFLYFNF